MATSPINLSSLLQSFGLGGASNIDVNSIVSQLMQVDEQPLTDLQNNVTDYQSNISAYGVLLSSISGLNTAVSAMQNSTTGLSATSSDTSYFTASAASGASVGSTPIQIDNIASSQSLQSGPFGATTSTVADLSGSATQQLQIQVGSNAPTTISINSSNNTLSGVASAINSANAGVSASVIEQSSNFVIGTSNNTIVFSDGTNNYTATIAAGNYSGTGLATAMQNAMDAAQTATNIQTSNTFAVDYSNTSLDKFTIKNTGGANPVTIDWSSSTATPQQLGFDPVAQSAPIAVNGALSGTNTVSGTYVLVLNATASGTANRVTIKADETGASNFNETGNNADKFGLSALAFDPTYNNGSYKSDGTLDNSKGTQGIQSLTQSKVGLDAELSVNGVTMYRANNTITDAIPGVTLNLLQAETTTSGGVTTPSPGSANLSVNVALDSSTLATELQSFVTAYNSAMTTVNGLYNPVTAQTSSADQQAGQGYLNGDSELLTLQQQLQAVPTTLYGNSSNVQNNYLATLGITTDKNGVMSFDASALSSAYTSANAGDITKTINNFANQLSASLGEAIDTAIPAEEQNMKDKISSAQSQESTLQEQLTYEQQSLTTEYTALATTVANDSSISSFLTTETGLLTKQTST